MFLDSADTGLYDYWKLLNRIGFDHVWGTSDLPENGLRADYRLLNMVDTIAGHVNDNKQPFFLHIINDQTHMPYEIVEQDKFNRFKGEGNKSLFIESSTKV